jgi:hypothetical protein
MKRRTMKYEEGSPVEITLLREQLGMKRYQRAQKETRRKERYCRSLG